MSYPIISADSHITEHPSTYVDYIDAKWRDKAPQMRDCGEKGDLFFIDGIKTPVPMGLVAAAGKPSSELTMTGVRFDELHRSGWDPTTRREDQIRDGIAAEVIYPTVGMVLCNHKDFDYKQACMDAYNRWIAEYCAHDPQRLLGCGQTALRSPEAAVQDLKEIKALGLPGVMVSGNPQGEDFDSPIWDPFWEAAVELGLPLSFHILTVRGSTRHRGPKLNQFMAIVRGNQDIIATLIFGGVFERHPGLSVVCVEADAGWVPHYSYRMDHAYKRHRHWLQPGISLSKLPSEYFAEHVYLTFQDDFVAFANADLMNWKRLMWANDFPHSDSTWPRSQEMLAEHARDLREEQRRAILCDNVAALYGIDTAALLS